MWNDAVLTFALYPLVLVAFVVIAVVTLFADLENAMPIVFALLAVIVGDVATRDGRANTLASLRAMPRLRENFVWWKLGSTLLLSLGLCALPMARTAMRGPGPLGALLVGILFLAAIATSLGVISSNAKTFIVVFLSFWYLVVNDRGANPWFDFAGFYGRASIITIGLYAAGSVTALVAAQTLYRARLRG
jgi:hypothetical protein